MLINTAELTALHRSTAMLTPHTKAPVEREALLSILDELLENRRLLARLGTDLNTVARHRPPQTSSSAIVADRPKRENRRAGLVGLGSPAFVGSNVQLEVHIGEMSASSGPAQ